MISLLISGKRRLREFSPWFQSASDSWTFWFYQTVFDVCILHTAWLSSKMQPYPALHALAGLVPASYSLSPNPLIGRELVNTHKAFGNEIVQIISKFYPDPSYNIKKILILFSLTSEDNWPCVTCEDLPFETTFKYSMALFLY